MNHELICCWLGLPADAWPPDHYRLLGLDPGEGDVARIEQHVHERHDVVRRYQVMHPEQATEAMNLLAQAFVCLTDAPRKLAYDAQLLGARPRPAPPPLPGPPPLPAPAEPRDPLAWLYTEGVNGPGGAASPPVRLTPVPEVKPAPPPAPPPEPIDPIREAAQRSRQAVKHLATRRALYQRVERTRHLQRLWHKLGKHINDTARTLTRHEASELYKLIEQVEDATDGFPLLGEAGQPGHLIIQLTQYDKSKSLCALDPLLRESLQRDWEGGLKFLEFHRDFLRGEIAASRQRTRGEHLSRAVRAWLNEKPSVALVVLLGLLAVGIVAWRYALSGN